jgi:hypothetical protein
MSLAVLFCYEVINVCNKLFGLWCGTFDNLFKDRKSFTQLSERTFKCSFSSAQSMLENLMFLLQYPSGIRSHEVVMNRNVPSATIIVTRVVKNRVYLSLS